LADSTPEAVIRDCAGQQFSVFKPALVDLAVSRLSPVSDEMARLAKDPAEIDRILERGAERARTVAAPVVKRTYEIIGMIG